MKKGIICALIGSCFFCSNSMAEIVRFNPGAVDTSFFYNSYDMPGVLCGKKLDGQKVSLDFYFTSNKIVRARKVEIELAIIQDDKVGAWPQGVSIVTGYLINSDGSAVTDVVQFSNNMTMPNQIWPGEGYSLPDGTEHLPAQTGYSALITGTRSKPLVFSGIHFDLRTPVLSGRKIIGCRLTLSNYHDYHDKSRTWRYPICITRKAPDHSVPKSTMSPH